jgi:hypothetical protein
MRIFATTVQHPGNVAVSIKRAVIRCPVMRRFWLKLRTNWTRADSIVLATNTAAFLVFLANCRLESVWICTIASAVPLAIQAAYAFRVGGPLRSALLFGALIAAAWPLGEGIVTHILGWWGEYVAPGPVIWRTPLYCVLIGGLASTHIHYVSRRTSEFGYGPSVAAANTFLTAFLLGFLGENFFVAANMWRYHESGLDWISVPAFVPVAYGLGYAILPALRDWRILPTAVVCGMMLLVFSVGLGLLTGFFPR